MTSMSKDTFGEEKVLFIGPGSRGGMLSVINSYREMFSPFKVIFSQCDGSKFHKGLKAFGAYTSFMWRMLFDRKIKIVHVHVAAGNSLWRKQFFVIMGHAFGKKVICHMHAGLFKEFYLTNPDKVKHALSRADVIVALSPQWQNFYQNIGCRNVRVIQNPIPSPETVEIKKDNYTHLLFLGKINGNKGIYELVEALKDVEDPVILHIGGIGEVEKVKALAEEIGVKDKIIFEGWVEGERKRKLLSQADIFVLPSYFEGVPISILEAMSYRTAIIATNVGGIPSVVTDNGLLVPPKDTKTLANAINVLIKNKEQRAQMAGRGYEYSKNYWDKNILSSLQNLYSTILTSE